MKNNVFHSLLRRSRSLTLLSAFLLTGASAFAVLTERPELSWKGNYDVKMISSQGMQAVWLSNTTPLTAIRPLTDEEMAYEYNYINNEVHIAGQATSSYCGVTPAIIPTAPANAVAVSQIYADCDDDASTFQSSAAFLDFGSEMGCTKVVAAYLYWVGSSSTDGKQLAAHSGVGSTLRSMPAGDWEGLGGNAYRTVKFKAPGMTSYVDVTASRYDLNPNGQGSGDRNICFADVTQHVKNRTGGLYWVANLRSGFGKGSGGATSGWSLVVIFEPPQCPHRTIKIWDGMEDISKGGSTNISFSFDAGDVPASGNSVSYLGISVLDGENVAAYLINKGEAPEFLEFTSYQGNSAGTTFKINPFADGQTAPFAGEPKPCYDVYNKKGVLLGCAQDGFSASRISTYDPELGTNGNDVSRLPAQANTLGYDAHHLRLPAGAMVPNATRVNMKYYAGPQGGTSPFMAYMAIQTLQPEIVLEKSALTEGAVPGGNFTYELNVKNVGTLAAASGAVIKDTIDKTMDYVGNAVLLDRDGNETPITAQVLNQGADANEVVTFTLPAGIEAGNGVKASDSLRVRFDVFVKGLDRTDIWSYGCNRYVKNKATITYSADGNSYKANSNATAGCDGASVYLYTPVSSAELDEQYKNTHIVTLDLGSNATKQNIVQTIRDSLVIQLSKLGLPSSDAQKYEVYDVTHTAVPASAFFTTDEAVQSYTAEAILDGDCEETYSFTVNVKAKPIVNIDTETEVGASGVVANGLTSAPGASDGAATLTIQNVSEAISSYTVNVTNASGATVYTASSAGIGTTTYTVGGLSKGDYTVFVTDNEGVATSYTITIDDPNAMTLSLTSSAENGKLCKYQPLTLSASVTSAPASGVTYAWLEEGVATGETTETKTVQSFAPTQNREATYTVYACANNNKYQLSQTVTVTAIPTPEIQVLPSDTGCRVFTLPTSYNTVNDNYQAYDPAITSGSFAATEVSGDPDIASADLTMSYFSTSGMPIQSPTIGQSGNVVARLTADGTCYSEAKTFVYIKDFNECYPIIVPKFFSPDGNTINDLFIVSGIEQEAYDNEQPKIVVFDRFGKKVFDGDREALINGWDGKCQDVDLPSGDYWYELTFKSLKSRHGHFTLKRRKE